MALQFRRLLIPMVGCLRAGGLSTCRRDAIHTSSTMFLWPKKPPVEDEPVVADDRDRVLGDTKDAGTNLKEVMLAGSVFEDTDKDKDHFLDKVKGFSTTITKHRHGQVEFIYAALRIMKDFNVHKDLEAYKALMDIFPKERMKPTNVIQYGFFHFAKQQLCAVKLLDEMEYHGVSPDGEMEALIISIFSKTSMPWRKVARQLYWFSKFKNANPYPLPEKMPLDALELAKIALKRMCIDLQTKIGVFAVSNLAFN